MSRATVAVLVATAACAGAGAAAASRSRFLYLALGDSSTASIPSFVDAAAAGAAASHHRRVTVRRLVEENDVAALDARVAASPNAVRAADLITVMIGVNQLVHVAFTNGCAASACAKAERAFERQYASLLDRLTALRPAAKAAYRLLTEYNLPGVFHGPAATAFRTALRAENRFVCAQAHDRGMQCVDVYTAFNGPDGTRDPRAAGLVRADNHPTAKGAALIASLIAASGA